MEQKSYKVLFCIISIANRSIQTSKNNIAFETRVHQVFSSLSTYNLYLLGFTHCACLQTRNTFKLRCPWKNVEPQAFKFITNKFASVANNKNGNCNIVLQIHTVAQRWHPQHLVTCGHNLVTCGHNLVKPIKTSVPSLHIYGNNTFSTTDTVKTL